MKIGTQVKINRGLFKGNVGKITGIVKYNNQDVYVVTIKRIDNATGHEFNAYATLSEGWFEEAK